MLFSLSFPQRQDLHSLISMAEKAESLGYHSIWLGDHYFNRSVFIALGLIAQATESIFFGTGVTNPFHITPAMLTTFGATLQEFSSGRFRMGIGTGDTDSLRIEGVIKPRNISAVMKNVVEDIKKLSTGKKAFFPIIEGSHTEGARLNYANLETRFPVYLGVLGNTMMKTAVQCCDGMLINSSNVQDALRALNILKNTSRDGLSVEKFQVIPFTLVEVQDKREGISSILKGIIAKIISDLPANYVKNFEEDALVVKKIRELVKQQRYPESFRILNQRLIDNFSITGSFDEITERLLEFEKIRIKEIIIGGTGIPNNYEKFMKELKGYLPDNNSF